MRSRPPAWSSRTPRRASSTSPSGPWRIFIARFYYYLHTQQSWSIPAAGAVAILIASPVLGVVLYVVLFRYLRLSSPLIKVVATIGLSVALPVPRHPDLRQPGHPAAPGLAPEPVRVFHFLGVPVTLDQVIVYISVVVIVVAGALVLKYSDVGLKVRAMVDSTAMTDLSGTNPTTVSIGVWAVSTFLAGLTGVLAAPIIGLDPTNFTLLIAASFAAVIAAKLRSLPIAVVVGLLMGVATSLIQRYLPPASAWTSEIIDAVPFIVIAVVLLYNLVRGGRVGETEGWGGALDRAIAPQGESRLAGLDLQRRRDGLAQLLRPVRRPDGPGRRRRGPAPDPRRLLGGTGRPRPSPSR